MGAVVVGICGYFAPRSMGVGYDNIVGSLDGSLAGGTLLVIADTIARTMFAPRQLPVGAVTALIGVPIFLALMRRQQPAL